MKTVNFDPRDPYFYNPIINSNFDFWQRIGGTSVTRTQASNGTGYSADRFAAAVNAGAAKSMTIQRSTSLPPSVATATYSYQVTNNTAIASFPAGELIACMEHVIEGTFLRPLANTAMTFGFWISSSVPGTYAVAMRRNGSVRSYVTTVTVDAASTWEYKTVNVPWDTSGAAQLYDKTGSFNILIGGLSGTTFQAPSLNQWNTGNYFTHSSVTNWGATSGAVLRLSQLQLRSGSRNLAEMRDGYVPFALNYINELQACQRYYEKSFDIDTAPTNGSNATSFSTDVGLLNVPVLTWVGSPGNYLPTIPFNTEKRAVPSVTAYGNSSGFWSYGVVGSFNVSTTRTYATNIGVNSSNTKSMSLVNNSTSNSLVGVQGHWAADAEL